MPLQGSKGLAQRETFEDGEVSIHSSKLPDKFLRPTFHFSAWCCLCRISAVTGRSFRQLSPATKKLQDIPCKKTSSLLKLFSFQHPDFQQMLKNVTDVLHFLHLSNLKKKNKKQTKLILEAKWASAFAHHIYVLKCNSSWIFIGKLQILEKKRFSVWSPNADFLRVAQQYCCAFDPLFLRCRKAWFQM